MHNTLLKIQISTIKKITQRCIGSFDFQDIHNFRGLIIIIVITNNIFLCVNDIVIVHFSATLRYSDSKHNEKGRNALGALLMGNPARIYYRFINVIIGFLPSFSTSARNIGFRSNGWVIAANYKEVMRT